MQGLELFEGQRILPQFGRIVDLAKKLDVGATVETIEKRVIPVLSYHFVFIGENQLVIAHAAERNFLPAGVTKKFNHVHVWYVNSAESYIHAEDFFARKRTYEFISVLVRKHQQELDAYM